MELIEIMELITFIEIQRPDSEELQELYQKRDEILLKYGLRWEN